MRGVLRSLREALAFMAQHGAVRSLGRKDAPWLIQFGKYGMCGVLATVVHNVIAVYLSWQPQWFPAVGELIDDDSARARNQTINNLIAFPFSNVAAYATNALWVFNTGRHARWKEFGYFTLISLISFLAGLLGGPLLVQLFGVPFWVSQAGFIVTSAMVNFLCRKFIVFHS